MPFGSLISRRCVASAGAAASTRSAAFMGVAIGVAGAAEAARGGAAAGTAAGGFVLLRSIVVPGVRRDAAGVPGNGDSTAEETGGGVKVGASGMVTCVGCATCTFGWDIAAG